MFTLVVLVAVLGCEREPGSQSAAPPAAIATTASQSAGSDRLPADPVAIDAEAAVNLQLVDRSGYDEVLAQHVGRVVLVDFWATWCDPCREQFPHTVALSKRYGRDQLAVISVSMDEPRDEASVTEFLRKQSAHFTNLLGTYGVGVEGFEAFEIDEGGVPHYKIYDQSGTLAHTTNDPEDVDRQLEQLIGEP